MDPSDPVDRDDTDPNTPEGSPDRDDTDPDTPEGSPDRDDTDPNTPEGSLDPPAVDVPTAAEQACFEAGIKFGSLYHQFAGTPVNPASAASLAAAIEAAIENQPHCEQVTVEMDTEALTAAIGDASASYTELTGRFMEVEMRIEREGCVVLTEMALENGYPRMSIVGVDRGES